MNSKGEWNFSLNTACQFSREVSRVFHLKLSRPCDMFCESVFGQVMFTSSSFRQLMTLVVMTTLVRS